MHLVLEEAQQGRSHLLLALGQGVAQAAKVGVHPALAQHVSERQLARHIGGEGRHQLQPLDALGMGTGHHPADPKARRQALGPGAAQQAVAPGVPALDGAGALAAKIELGVDVVLHQGHLMGVEQLHQCLLVAIRHGVTERMLHVAHQPARLDGALGEGLGEQGEIDAHPGDHGYFHHVELEPLYGLQGAVEGGGLHHHPVPGLGQHLQA
ncbi:hypothetical protein D3C80_882020 [compost metagenome]